MNKEFSVFVNVTGVTNGWFTVSASDEEHAVTLVDAIVRRNDNDWRITDIAFDRIEGREYTESELAAMERERQLAAGQLELPLDGVK